jgi:hypothetical protein
MKLVIALLLLLGIFPLPALSGCQITDYYVGFAGARLEQSVPLAVVADIGGIAASVTVFLVGNLNVFLRCECEPCCGTDEDQQAALTFRAAADILGGRVVWAGAFEEHKRGTGSSERCKVELAQSYEAGASFPAVGIEISVPGLTHATARFAISSSQVCECVGNPSCVGNHPPHLILTERLVHLPYGGVAEFEVMAVDVDEQLNLGSFYAYSTQHVEAKVVQEDFFDPAFGTGRVRISHTGDRFPFTVRLTVGVKDKVAGEDEESGEAAPFCASSSGEVVVLVHHPPEIRKVEQAFVVDGRYVVNFEVWDPEFDGRDCTGGYWDPRLELMVPDREVVYVEVQAEGGEILESNVPHVSPIECERLPPLYELPPFMVAFQAAPNVCPRGLRVTARDAYGIEREVFIPLNGSPMLVQADRVFKLKLGDSIAIDLNYIDPDKDTVVIAQLNGPGELQGNRWSWQVPGTYYGPAWRLVGFELRDSCGGENTAYFSVHVLQPPRVHGGHVSLAPGEETGVRIYVEDPDSPSLDFSFDPPGGIEVEVVGEEPVRDYEDFGQGGRIY